MTISLILILLALPTIMGIAILIIYHTTHRSMTSYAVKRDKKNSKRSNVFRFIENWKSSHMESDDIFEGSYFNTYTDSSYHASIIKLYGVYYKYDFLNWILIQLWIIFGDKHPNKVQSGMEGDIEDLLLDISDLSFVLKTIVKSHTSYYSVEIQFSGMDPALESTNIKDLVDKIVEFESRIRSGWKLKSNSIVKMKINLY